MTTDKKMYIDQQEKPWPTASASLEYLLELQKDQQAAFEHRGIGSFSKCSHVDRENLMSLRCTQLIEEVIEMLRAIGYKEHRKYDGPSATAEREALMEWADCFKYLLIIALLRGWDASNLIEAFNLKTVIADAKLQELSADDGASWVVFDIDDVLADYTGFYCDLLLQSGMKEPGRILNTKSIGEQFGLSLKQWEAIKHSTRSDGSYARMDVITGGREALEAVEAMGYNVMLMTNRPVDRYPTLYADTVQWLCTNNIHYDKLVFSIDKVMEVCRVLRKKGSVALAIDDHPSNIKGFKELHIDTVMVCARENNFGAGTVDITNLASFVSTFLGAGPEAL